MMLRQDLRAHRNPTRLPESTWVEVMYSPIIHQDLSTVSFPLTWLAPERNVTI